MLVVRAVQYMNDKIEKSKSSLNAGLSQELFRAYEQLSIADTIRSLRYEGLDTSSNDQQQQSRKCLSPEDFLCHNNRTEPALLAQQRIHAMKVRIEQYQIQEERKAEQKAKEAKFINSFMAF